jgi:Ni/Co efflux regulator RcnB
MGGAAHRERAFGGGGGMGGGERHLGRTGRGGRVNGTAIIGGTGHGDRTGRGRHVNNNTNGRNGLGARAGRGGRSGNNAAFARLRRNVTAQRHFHGGNYRRPQGYYYRRWSYGDTLPALFFAQNYWISNYDSYDLPYPPEGATWVRYGDDALLVDEDSGEIIQVVYGIFY